MNHPHTPGRRRRKLAAFAATATAAFLVLGSAAAPAVADTGAKGSYVGKSASGLPVETNKGKIGTSLFNLKLTDGTALQTYCIDFETRIRDGSKYQEDAWDTYPGKGEFADPAKVHWILQNSYPSVDTGALAKKSGADTLSKEQALAGTQAAIWHFSNSVKLTEQNDGNVTKLYDYLVDNAKELPQTGEPEGSLNITPKSAKGEGGEDLGPFTVHTSAASVPLKVDGPKGVKLVDPKSGKKVTKAADGDKFAITIPKGSDSGEATVSASATTDVHQGRLFKGIEGQRPTQTLITAESGKATVESAIEVKWSGGGAEKPTPTPTKSAEKPAPTPSESSSPSPSESAGKPAPDESDKDRDEGGLPLTGGALTGLAAAAVAAVAAGATAMYLSRKRRTNTGVEE